MTFQNPVRKTFSLPGLIRAVGRPVSPDRRDHAAAELADAIAGARAHAIANGVRAIPGGIARGLFGYFPEDLMRRCRFAVDASGPIRLPQVRLVYGHPAFTTLGDVVLFQQERAAQTDLKAWAHALTHVMQYQRWGSAEFCRRVVQDNAAVEREATANAARCLVWMRDKNALAHA